MEPTVENDFSLLLIDSSEHIFSSISKLDYYNVYHNFVNFFVVILFYEFLNFFVDVILLKENLSNVINYNKLFFVIYSLTIDYVKHYNDRFSLLQFYFIL